MEFKGPSFDLSFPPSFAQFSASSKQERLWQVNEGGVGLLLQCGSSHSRLYCGLIWAPVPGFPLCRRAN